MIPFLDVRAVNDGMRQELESAGQLVMRSGVYVLGPQLESFEHELAKSEGVDHAIGVGNGLDALTLTLLALGIGPGDEVIVPSHTFIATWLAVTHVGATVVPVDIDASTYNLDPRLIEDAVTSRTVAIIAVHLYGRPADMVAINAIAARHGLAVIADGAQSIGAMLDDQPVARFAQATTLSFYPAKNLGALGDGGAVLTDDISLAGRVRAMRNYGSASKYTHLELGINSRLDEMQAAFLRVKLPYLEDWNQVRSQVAQTYGNALKDTGLMLPNEVSSGESVWHLYVIRCPPGISRDELQLTLGRHGIQTLIHYPLPPHRQRAYEKLSLGPLPVADEVCGSVLSLPMSPVLSESDVHEVVDRTTAALADLDRRY